MYSAQSFDTDNFDVTYPCSMPLKDLCKWPNYPQSSMWSLITSAVLENPWVWAGLRTFPLKPNVMKKDMWFCNSYLIIEFCNKRKLVGLDKFDDVISLGFTIIVSTSFIKLSPEKCRKMNEFHMIKLGNLAAHLKFGIILVCLCSDTVILSTSLSFCRYCS